MRIAFVGRGTQSPGLVGGVQSYLRRLATGLKAHGHEAVFELWGDAPGTPVARVHRSGSAALEAALERDPDVLQITFGLGPGTVGRNTRALRRVEERLGTHFVFPPRPESPSPWFKAAYRATYTGSLVPSPRLKDALGRWGRAVLVPPAASDDHFALRRTPPGGAVRFAYAGRLDHDKGLGDTLAAFDVLVKERPDDVSLRVMGHGVHEMGALVERRSYARLERLEPIAPWTRERSEHMLEFFASTDVLILPYRDLARTVDLPLLVAEGMAAGCAIVTTGVGDVPWLTGPAAAVVAPGDTAALADVVRAYIDDPKRARTAGAMLRQRAHEWGLDPHGMARSYLKGLGLA